MRRVLVLLCFIFVGGLASGQESIYSLSTGTFFVHGNLSAVGFNTPSSTETIDALFLPVRLTYFSGSREWGGWIASYETQILSFAAAVAGRWDGKIGSLYHRKGSLGYQFYGKISDTLLFRAGPTASMILSTGSYQTSTGDSGSLIQAEFMLGADGEVEFFPFDTDSGLVNGMHLLLGFSVDTSPSHIGTVLVSPRLGGGFIL